MAKSEIERIQQRIYVIRNQRVMIDRDLAKLYGVETRALKQAVKRNIARFPKDFMFEMTEAELQDWRSQNVISNSDKMGLRYKPFAFTELGVAMLSSVLKSNRAIQVNIKIMQVFVRTREIMAGQAQLIMKLERLEKRVGMKFPQFSRRLSPKNGWRCLPWANLMNNSREMLLII